MRILKFVDFVIKENIEMETVTQCCKDFKCLVERDMIWLVRAVDFTVEAHCKSLRETGRESYFDLNSSCSLLLPQKFTLNFAMNELVRPFGGDNNWDCHKYIFIENMKHFKGEIVGGNEQDIISVVGHKWSPESILLLPDGKDTPCKETFTKFQGTIVRYNYPRRWDEAEEYSACAAKLMLPLDPGEETPRNAVRRVLDSRVSMQWDEEASRLASALCSYSVQEIGRMLLQEFRDGYGNPDENTFEQAKAFSKFLWANKSSYTALGDNTTINGYLQGSAMSHMYAMQRVRAVRECVDGGYGMSTKDTCQAIEIRMCMILFVLECALAVSMSDQSPLVCALVTFTANNKAQMKLWLGLSLDLLEEAVAYDEETFDERLTEYLDLRNRLRDEFLTEHKTA